MAFNNSLNGIENEYDFVKNINNKHLKNINFLIQLFLYELYDNKIVSNDVVYSWKNPNLQKTDIFIMTNRIIKRISIKKGAKNSVHIERITDFIHF